MKRCAWLILVLVCLLLTGCNWMDGNYHSVTLHQSHNQTGEASDVSASNYGELSTALTNMVAQGQEKGIIYITEYDPGKISSGIAAAVQNICYSSPLGAYAVEEIRYELGTNSGKSAIAVEITYRHSQSEIQRIQKISNMETAENAIFTALAECESGLVLWVEHYAQLDIDQLVEDYAQMYPQYVMEVPEVVVNTYPESGTARILELKFSYQNSREDLRNMQSYVTAIFKAAGLYVSSDDTDGVKLSQLYSFLMERFDYQVDTSITPSYSLLRHGVGDSKAFAMVYAAMCRQADLQCYTVTGTRNGTPWCWNIVLDGEQAYHVDLLRCVETGGLQKLTDNAMSGYVWDYSAYPKCPEEDAGTDLQTDLPPQEETDASEENGESATVPE